MNESTVPTTMRASQATGYGPPSVLQYVETKSPTITSPNQLIVKVAAAGVNPADWKVRKGNLRLVKSTKFPAIFGGDYSGTVVAKSENVKGFNVGDEVFGTFQDLLSGNGTYAEYIRLDTQRDAIAHKPSSITHAEAAGVGVCILTAWEGLAHVGRLPLGEEAKKSDLKILIIGASGGVGTFAVQLAKRAHHAHVVAVCSEKNAEAVKGLGADRVIDYTAQHLAQVLKDEVETFDLVFDCVGGDEYYQESFEILKKDGVFVSAVGPIKYGGSQKLGVADIFTFGGGSLWKKLFGERRYGLVGSLPYADMPKLVPYLERREVVTLINKEFDLKDVAKAHELSETLHAVGKIVIRVAS